MRILADEYIPRASILLLREAGHDVLAISELSPGLGDSDVLRMSIEEGRLLITFDRDFGALMMRGASSNDPGLILFRILPSSPKEPAQALMGLFEQQAVRFIGRITVIDRDHIRQRLLPGEKPETDA